MARELADPLKQLDAALSVTPSPEAVARVRERVRQEHESTRGAYGWWWAAAAGTVVVAVGIASAILLTSRRLPDAPPTIVATNTSTPTNAVAPAVAKASPAISTRNVARTRPTPIPAAADSRVATLESPREPEVLVPPDEGIALRRLLIAMREGRAAVPSAGSRVAEDADGHMLEPTSIDIPSIKIELLPGTPVAGSGGKEK